MASQLRTWSELWGGLGFGCLLGAVLVSGFDAWQFTNSDGAPLQHAQGFDAVLQRSGKGYVLETAGSSRVECTRDGCGYPSVGVDLGLHRSFYMADGRVIGVKRDGELIDLRGEVRARQLRKLWIGAALSGLSLPCFWAAWHARKARKPDSAGANA